MGERGILDEVAALLVARPAVQRLGEAVDDAGVAAHVEAQRGAVRRVLDAYRPGLPCVLGIDAGHTDPQCILPVGSTVRIDGPQRRIDVWY